MRWMNVVLTMAILLAAGSVMGQNMKSFEFMVGSLNPKDVKSGIVWDVKYGIAVDEAGDIGLGIALFNKSYRKTSTVAEEVSPGGTVNTTKQLEVEYNALLLPLTAYATVHLPMTPRFGLYLGAGLSWQFLFNKENNFEEDISESRTYNGGGWVARIGGEMQLGTRSSLLGEIHYNHCKVKGNADKKAGLPVWDEVDVTGMGFKVGLRMELY